MGAENEKLQDDQWLSIRATFYIFAQRIADGTAKESEVAFMDKVFDLANAYGDWDWRIKWN